MNNKKEYRINACHRFATARKCAHSIAHCYATTYEWWQRLDAALTAVTIGLVMLAFIAFAVLTSRDAMAAAQEAGSQTHICQQSWED